MTKEMEAANAQLVAGFIPWFLGQVMDLKVRCMLIGPKMTPEHREECFNELIGLAQVLAPAQVPDK